jgi:hypothetical protein
MSEGNDPPNLRYRRLAQRCIEALQNTIQAEARATLTRLAELWTRIADEYEAKRGRDSEKSPDKKE